MPRNRIESLVFREGDLVKLVHGLASERTLGIVLEQTGMMVRVKWVLPPRLAASQISSHPIYNLEWLTKDKR